MDDNDRKKAGLPLDPLEGMERVKTAAEEAREARALELERCAPPLSTLLPNAIAAMQARSSGLAKPIVTPWATVNAELGGGIWPGLHVLSGTTGSGKSQWALQLALHAAKAGHPVLYVGLELGHTDLVARLLGLELKAKWSGLFLGSDADGIAKAADLQGAIAKLPFRLEVGQSYGWHAGLLAERVRALREEHPEEHAGDLPILVVIDYLQVVAPEPDNQRQELRERIGKAAYAARMVARDYGAAVLALSSVSRENAKLLGVAPKPEARDADLELGTGDPGRLVGLGKESGEIEYSADSVLVLARKSFREAERHSEMHLAVAKLRARPEGHRGWLLLNFNGGRFWDPTETKGTRV